MKPKIICKKAHCLGCVLLAAVVLVSMCPPLAGEVRAEAAGKVNGIVLENGKSMQVDLNGKGKKNLSYSFEDTSNTSAKINIKVDGKSIFQKSYSDPAGLFSGTVYMIDLDTKDKYKELFYEVCLDDSFLFDIGLLRYDENGKATRYPISAKKWKGRLYRLKGHETAINSDGAGTLYITTDMPFANDAFGSYHAVAKGKLGNKKCRIKNSKYYAIDSEYLKWMGGFYEIKSATALYKSASGKSVKGVLASGTKFKALSIHPINIQPESDDEYANYADLYVKIRTTDGKTGWVFFPKHGGYGYGESYILKVKPSWG